MFLFYKRLKDLERSVTALQARHNKLHIEFKQFKCDHSALPVYSPRGGYDYLKYCPDCNKFLGVVNNDEKEEELRKYYQKKFYEFGG